MEAAAADQTRTGSKGSSLQPNGQCIKEPERCAPSYNPDILILNTVPSIGGISCRSPGSRKHLKSEGQQSLGSRALSLALRARAWKRL